MNACVKCGLCGETCHIYQAEPEPRNLPAAKAAEVASFYRAGLRNVRFFGRMYELGLVGQLKLATRQFGKDVKLGRTMVKRRKLGFLPHFASLGKARKVFSRVTRLESK